jgi:hypothetical protein
MYKRRVEKINILEDLGVDIIELSKRYGDAVDFASHAVVAKCRRDG